MVMRIRQHINYPEDKKAKKPAPPSEPETPQKKPVSMKGRRGRRPIHMTTHDDIFSYVLGYCQSGDRAPTAQHLISKFGAKANSMLIELAYEGRLCIEIYGRNWRVIDIKGLRTAMPKDGVQCYRRLDKGGDYWRRGGSWVKQMDALTSLTAPGT